MTHEQILSLIAAALMIFLAFVFYRVFNMMTEYRKKYEALRDKETIMPVSTLSPPPPPPIKCIRWRFINISNCAGAPDYMNKEIDKLTDDGYMLRPDLCNDVYLTFKKVEYEDAKD